MTTDWPLDRRLEDDELILAIGEAILRPLGSLDKEYFQPLDTEGFAMKLGVGGRIGDSQEKTRFLAANPDLRDRLLEHVWHFVGLGFLFPEGGAADFKATTRGRAYFLGQDPAAVVRGGLDSHMDTLGWGFGDPPRFYARLSQACLLDGHPEAAIVMLGSSVEWLIRDIADHLEALRLLPALKKRSARPLAAENLTWLRNALETERRSLEAAMRANDKETGWIDDLRHSVVGAGEAIRMARNDYAHPTGFTADREKAMGLLALFPGFASACAAARTALN